MHGVRFGLLPQVIPVLASQVLYYFESNTRSATIIGIVGAGGIGLQLSEQIRVLEWQKVAFIILLILITVAIDRLGLVASCASRSSARLRRRAAVIEAGGTSPRPRTRMRSAGKARAARGRAAALPAEVGVDALDHDRIGRPERKIEPRGVGRLDDRRREAGLGAR